MGTSAVQKLILFLHLPLIFPDLVENKICYGRWEVISYLLHISNILFLLVIFERKTNIIKIRTKFLASI